MNIYSETFHGMYVVLLAQNPNYDGKNGEKQWTITLEKLEPTTGSKHFSAAGRCCQLVMTNNGEVLYHVWLRLIKDSSWCRLVWRLLRQQRHREKHSEHQSIHALGCLTRLCVSEGLLGLMCNSHLSPFLSVCLCLLVGLKWTERKQRTPAPPVMLSPYLDTIGELSGLKKAESKWGSQRGREDRRDYQLILRTDNPEGALSFFQDDADKTVDGLRCFASLAFSRKSCSAFSFALSGFIAPQRTDISGTEEPGNRG